MMRKQVGKEKKYERGQEKRRGGQNRRKDKRTVGNVNRCGGAEPSNREQ